MPRLPKSKESADAPVSERPFASPQAFGCELRKIVDAKLLFDGGNTIYDFEKAIIAEEFIFLFLEIFA